MENINYLMVSKIQMRSSLENASDSWSLTADHSVSGSVATCQPIRDKYSVNQPIRYQDTEAGQWEGGEQTSNW